MHMACRQDISYRYPDVRKKGQLQRTVEMAEISELVIGVDMKILYFNANFFKISDFASSLMDSESEN